MARRRHLKAGFRRALLAEVRQIGGRPGLMFMLAPFPLLLFAILAAIMWITRRIDWYALSTELR